MFSRGLGQPLGKGSQPTGREPLSLSLPIGDYSQENEFMLAPALKPPELWTGMKISDPLFTSSSRDAWPSYLWDMRLINTVLPGIQPLLFMWALRPCWSFSKNEKK